jgi:hypothetical protein
MIIITILLLLLLLFYFHLSAQYKKPREPFEIYETTFETRKQLETLNAHKQPYLFGIESLCPLTFTTTLDELDAIVTLFDTTMPHNNGTHDATILELPLKGCVSITAHLPHYVASAIIHPGDEENTIWKTIADEFDDILSPPFVVSKQLGILFGSNGAHTAPEYHTQTAKYLIVASGEITVKITSIRNCERLNGGKCRQKIITPSSSQFTHWYCNGVNIWDHNNPKLQKMPFLQFTVGPGFALSIPPYCIWSIQYDKPGTSVFSMDYISFMNSIANIGNWYQQPPFYIGNKDDDAGIQDDDTVIEADDDDAVIEDDNDDAVIEADDDDAVIEADDDDAVIEADDDAVIVDIDE